jgi:hypothetical protein
LQFLRRNGSIELIETGVLPGIFIEVQKKMSCVGLRNTLEPDPDNTGVGSFLQPSGILHHLPLRRKLLCFM